MKKENTRNRWSSYAILWFLDEVNDINIDRSNSKTMKEAVGNNEFKDSKINTQTFNAKGNFR